MILERGLIKMKTYFKPEEVEEMVNTEEAKVLVAAHKLMPNCKVKSIVHVPGAYNIYAVGTDADVTVLVWIHDDGHLSCDVVCW